jgi:retron-type reverse transcriptase
MLTDIDEDTMAKYEYINLFRKDFRWKGVPQGSGISPILSVLILMTIDSKLNRKGIFSIKYADDGLFYSHKKNKKCGSA